MATKNSNENGSTEKIGQIDYSDFVSDRTYDCHMVAAHLRAIHALITKIQEDVRNCAEMRTKEDLSSASYLLRSAGTKLDSVIGALDDSSWQFQAMLATEEA